MTTSIEADLRAALERADRRRRTVVRVLPYVVLALSLALTVVQWSQDRAVSLTVVTALTAAAAAWVHLLHDRYAATHPSPVVRTVYFVGLLVLAGALVAISPWYGLFTVVGYLHAETALRGRWRYVGVAVTSAITAAAWLGGWSGITVGYTWLAWLALAVFVGLVAGAFLRFGELEEERTLRQRRSLDELRAANVRLEEAVRDNAALHAQLLVQAREAGVQDERQRMAREIHDTLAQGLAGILAQLQAAEQTLPPGSPERRQVGAAVALAREGLSEARRTVHAVEPQVLAEARLPEALGELAARWHDEHGTEALMTTTGHPQRLHPDIEVTLLRTAQEALTNVAKHAHAHRVVLTLSYMGDVVTLDVLDDGVGFDVAALGGPSLATPGRDGAPRDGGFGLAAMRQRVQRLAGRLEIESEPGGGTSIAATVPAIPALEDAA